MPPIKDNHARGFGIFGRIELPKKCPNSLAAFLYKAGAGYWDGTYGKIQDVAAKKNILDVYRDFRKKDPSVCYAFGDVEFFTFYMTDAHRVHNALPDLRIEHERCDFLRSHKLAFFPTAARLKTQGVRVAMVARTKTQNGGYTYRIDGYSYDVEDAAQ